MCTGLSLIGTVYAQMYEGCPLQGLFTSLIHLVSYVTCSDLLHMHLALAGALYFILLLLLLLLLLCLFCHLHTRNEEAGRAGKPLINQGPHTLSDAARHVSCKVRARLLGA